MFGRIVIVCDCVDAIPFLHRRRIVPLSRQSAHWPATSGRCVGLICPHCDFIRHMRRGFTSVSPEGLCSSMALRVERMGIVWDAIPPSELSRNQFVYSRDGFL